MTLDKLKKDLKAVGVSFERFEDNLELNLDYLLKKFDISSSVLINGFTWNKSSEGEKYWREIHKQLYCLTLDEGLPIQEQESAHVCQEGATPLMGFWICKICGNNMRALK